MSNKPEPLNSVFPMILAAAFNKITQIETNKLLKEQKEHAEWLVRVSNEKKNIPVAPPQKKLEPYTIEHRAPMHVNKQHQPPKPREPLALQTFATIRPMSSPSNNSNDLLPLYPQPLSSLSRPLIQPLPPTHGHMSVHVPKLDPLPAFELQPIQQMVLPCCPPPLHDSYNPYNSLPSWRL
jgi:hypothetical protein